MKRILNDVYRDALAKLNESTKDCMLLTDAAVDIIMLSCIARKEGELCLEELVEYHESAFLKWLVTLVVDGTDSELLSEMAVNEYWMRASEGTLAMVDYMYIRGMLLVQEGLYGRILADFLQTLIPQGIRSEYQEKLQVKLNALEEKNRKENAEKLACIRPAFHNEAVIEKIHILENKICKFSDRTMQRVIIDLDNYCAEVCIYAMDNESRKKVLDNMSLRYAGEVMESIVHFASIEEQEVLKCIEGALNVINKLLEIGEIYEPDEQ
ncbi:MAG: hypothetical protein NC489_27680 [Ruminococcus flavefaciens]|nr:hypothetical protein [Ruminococcus flavefaciens]